MEAKDMVMSKDEATTWHPVDIPREDRVLVPYAKVKAQAEISFKAGYEQARKLPKGKPPLLSNGGIIQLASKLDPDRRYGFPMDFVKEIAQAQREADIKHYEETYKEG